MSAIFWGRNSTARPRSVQKRPFRPSRISPTSTQKTSRPCPEGPTTFPTHIHLGTRNDLANTVQKRPARWTRFEYKCARVTSFLPPCPICAITNPFFFEGNGGFVFLEVFGLRRIGRLKMEVGFGFGVQNGAWTFERDEVVEESD